MTEKNEAALLAQSDPKEEITAESIALFFDAVKKNDLRTALALAGLTLGEAVALLGIRFPSLDKTTLSKCCNSDKYGCTLHPDGYDVLRSVAGIPQEAAAEPRKRRRKSTHKFTCRIAGRLPDGKFWALQRYIRLEGWDTIQDWVTAQVDNYLSKMEEKYGAGSSDCREFAEDRLPGR